VPQTLASDLISQLITQTIIPLEQAKREMLEILYRDGDITLASVTSFSSHTSKARGLKIGVHNSYMDGSKVTDQLLYTLPGS